MDTVELIKDGGVLAFAGLVLVILRSAIRELRPVLRGFVELLGELREELFEVRITIAAMLERDRIRDNRRRRETSNPPMRVVPSVPTGEFDAEETTDIATLIEKQRAEAMKKRHERAPRPGTHHDKDR